MPTAQQCKTYAAEYKRLGMETDISIRRATLLMAISRNWATLANQLDHLTVIMKRKASRPPQWAAQRNGPSAGVLTEAQRY
jgi:hypothetical protein